MAYEHVHHHSVVVYRPAVGGEVDCSLAGLSLHPNHDRTSA